MREHKEHFSYVSSGESISLRISKIEDFYSIDFMVV